MATIVPSTTYPDGSAISVAGHNANIYSTTSGEGIFSEPNGGIGVVNLGASFSIKDEHVMSEEATMARMDSSVIATDIYNNAFGVRDDQDASYVPIAGLSERVFFPYDMSTVIWQWSFFVAGWIPYLLQYQTGNWDTGEAQFRLFIDGIEHSAFRRKLPISGDLVIDWADTSSSPTEYELQYSGGTSINKEQNETLWFDISKLQKNVSKGYHELVVKLYLPRVVFSGEEDELTVQAGTADFATNGSEEDMIECTVHQRVTLGTRNVRCIAFK